MIRYGYPLFGLRYCGDMRTGVVHDLENEQVGCGVARIIAADHARPFYTLDSAVEKGFIACPFCVPAVRRPDP
jgi:hypothetical protein